MANANVAIIRQTQIGVSNVLANMQSFRYQKAFSRNICWITEQEQSILRGKRIAIAGLGDGDGGFHPGPLHASRSERSTSSTSMSSRSRTSTATLALLTACSATGNAPEKTADRKTSATHASPIRSASTGKASSARCNVTLRPLGCRAMRIARAGWYGPICRGRACSLSTLSPAPSYHPFRTKQHTRRIQQLANNACRRADDMRCSRGIRASAAR